MYCAKYRMLILKCNYYLHVLFNVMLHVTVSITEHDTPTDVTQGCNPLLKRGLRGIQ